MFRSWLATEQYGRGGKQRAVNTVLDLSFRHQCEELLFVVCPIALFFLVGVQHFLGRGQKRFMHVFRAANLSQKETKIVSLCKPRQLGNIVQSDIEKSLDSLSPNKSEELLGGLLRETDCKDFHVFSSGGSNSERSRFLAGAAESS